MHDFDLCHVKRIIYFFKKKIQIQKLTRFSNKFISKAKTQFIIDKHGDLKNLKTISIGISLIDSKQLNSVAVMSCCCCLVLVGLKTLETIEVIEYFLLHRIHLCILSWNAKTYLQNNYLISNPSPLSLLQRQRFFYLSNLPL